MLIFNILDLFHNFQAQRYDKKAIYKILFSGTIPYL